MFTGFVAVTVKLDVPAARGVPASVPSVARVRPAGTAPVVTANVNGPAGPVAVNACEYASPAVPLTTVAGLSATGGQRDGRRQGSGRHGERERARRAGGGEGLVIRGSSEPVGECGGRDREGGGHLLVHRARRASGERGRPAVSGRDRVTALCEQ